MSDDATAADSPRAIVERLRATYVSPADVPNELNLDHLFSLDSDDRGYRRDRLDAFARTLADAAALSLALDDLRAAVDAGGDATGPSRDRLAYYETALAYAGVLVDVTRRYPDVERRAVTRRLNESIRGDPDVEALRSAGLAVLDLARAVAAGDDLLASVDPGAFAHPDDTSSRLRSLVRDRVETGDPDAVARLGERVETTLSRKWTREDLLSFGPLAFEQLLADCWRDYHNAAETTRGSRDRGVDVVVETRDGDRLLVQAKRYEPPNTVGVADVQRTAGLLEEFPADRAVVVTSSSFTGSAAESAEAMERLSVVDGDRLCRWLTDSSLAPPLAVSR